jgi:hypothetical protein
MVTVAPVVVASPDRKRSMKGRLPEPRGKGQGESLSFLHRNREGAFVVLALIDCARCGGWQQGQGMLRLPGIAGKEPLEVLKGGKRTQ